MLASYGVPNIQCNTGTEELGTIETIKVGGKVIKNQIKYVIGILKSI